VSNASLHAAVNWSDCGTPLQTDWLYEKMKPQKMLVDGSDIVDNPMFVLVNAAVFRVTWKTPPESGEGRAKLVPSGSWKEGARFRSRGLVDSGLEDGQ